MFFGVNPTYGVRPYSIIGTGICRHIRMHTHTHTHTHIQAQIYVLGTMERP